MRKNESKGISKSDAARSLATLPRTVFRSRSSAQIRSDVPDAVGNVDILAQISVLGRSRTLVCKVVDRRRAAAGPRCAAKAA